MTTDYAGQILYFIRLQGFHFRFNTLFEELNFANFVDTRFFKITSVLKIMVLILHDFALHIFANSLINKISISIYEIKITFSVSISISIMKISIRSYLFTIRLLEYKSLIIIHVN